MERMLIVEDDELFRNSLKVFLEKEGWEVEGVESVERAKEKLSENRFDIILTDYQFPSSHDGLFLLGVLDKEDSRPPVILMSGSTQKGLEVIAKEHGAVAFLKKPFSLDELIALCNKMTQKET